MIRSMTAFARSERRGDWGQLTWELRSVNHRYLDLYPRLTESLRSLEPRVRERCASRLGRGKVELSLRFQPSVDAQAYLAFNRDLAARLVTMAAEVKDLLGGGGDLTAIDVLRWPGVAQEPEPNLAPVVETALSALDEALTVLVETRLREGQQIHRFIEQRCHNMTELVKEVRGRRPQMLARLKEKLEARLAELVIGADPGRLEQEMVIVAQKLDVDEELDRLDAHLSEIGRVLRRREPVGRLALERSRPST